MLHDLDPHTDFVPRHIGPSPDDQQKMLQAIGSGSVDDLVAEVVPTGILKREPLDLPASRSEPDVLADLRQVASRNPVFRSEEHTSELQSLMRISYAVFCLKKKNHNVTH